MTAAPPRSSPLRYLIPSARDTIFIFLFWSLLAGPLLNRPLADADIGWHIRAGEMILANRSLPRTDPFSSTMQGQPWFAWEWLYDCVLGVLHRACGLNGVVWLCALLIAFVFAFLLGQLVRRGTGLLLAVFLMLLAEAASAIHLFARPHIVSWLFSLLWFMQLERWEQSNSAERRKIPRRIVWFFPVSMLLWVNLHGGWLFGIALLALYALAAVIDSWRVEDAIEKIRAVQRARSMIFAGVTSAIATLANPFGWRLHAHIYNYLTDRYLMNRIEEFRSPNFHGWAERAFVVILIALLLAFATANSPTSRSRLRLSNLFVTLLAVYAGLFSARNLPTSSMLLALIAGPLLWRSIEGLREKPGAFRWLRSATSRLVNLSDRLSAQEMQLGGHLWPVAALSLSIIVCLHGGRLGKNQVLDAHFDSQKVPVEAVNFLESQSPQLINASSPVFSTDSWGGYLIFRLYPTRKVAMDDRHDLYGSSRVRDYLILMQGESGWRDVLTRWNIQTALLPVDSTAVNLLRELPQDWKMVHEDKVAVVFVKR